MKKRIAGIVLILILALSVLAGCSSAERTAEDSSDYQPGETAAGANAKADVDFGGVVVEADDVSFDEKSAGSTGIVGTGIAGQSVQNAILAQRKIIRNANLSIEVKDFNAAYGKINSMISGFGFIQQTNIVKDKIYVNSEKRLITRGYIVIRVDKDKFEQIMNDVKGLGLVVEENISSNDVTDKYFDIESRLRLLRYEESRLEEYLKKIEDPDTIFKTQSRLTDIRHEIEGLTGTLRKWNDLIDLSTITINITEEVPDSGKIPEDEKSYGQRLIDSLKGAVNFCGEILLILVQIIPVLILLGLLAFVVLLIVRKSGKDSRGGIFNKKNDSSGKM